MELEHHLSKEARIRQANPMKAIWKLAYGVPNLISLANGKRNVMYIHKRDLLTFTQAIRTTLCIL